jgi:hypothetical protein
MKSNVIAGSLFAISLAAGTLLAASLPKTTITGEYMEARTADVFTGPCFANSEVGLKGDLAVLGWHIDRGAYQGVTLDGLSVVAAVRASGTLGDWNTSAYPVHSVLIVDQKANPEQRLALKAFAKKMGGDLLNDVVRLEYQPIEFAVKDNNVHQATATMKAGNLVALVTRAVNDGDMICHNEDVWYSPLAKTDHAMPAVTVAHTFSGAGLGSTWSSPMKRSAFVATFHLDD